MKDDLKLPKTYLVDASVLIAAFAEDYAAAQNALAGSDKIYTIDLAEIEAANVFKTKNATLTDLNIFRQVISEPPFVRLPLQNVDTETAFRIAADFNTTVYDALYHAVALKLSLTFLTLDKAYYEKTKSVGWIELLI